MNEENFIELTPDEETEEPCEDSAEVLLKRYEKRRNQKTDDIFAMQAVVCVLLAAALFTLNLVYPELCGPVYQKLRELAEDEKEIMPNLIDLVMSKWSS